MMLLPAMACWPGQLPEWDLEQMENQRRYDPYEANPFFADRRAMRTPPPGTVSREEIIGEPAFTEGKVGGRDVEAVPLRVTMDLLRTGRFHYENVCAACHGVLGDGRSVVAEKMRRRLPPSLVSADVRDLPPGRVFDVITHGYGLMPAFAGRIEPADRWAIVAYLGALQLSAGRRLAELPDDLQEKAREALR